MARVSASSGVRPSVYVSHPTSGTDGGSDDTDFLRATFVAGLFLDVITTDGGAESGMCAIRLVANGPRRRGRRCRRDGLREEIAGVLFGQEERVLVVIGLVEAGCEDGLDGSLAQRPDLQGPAAGGFQAFDRVGAKAPHEPEAAPVTLLAVSAGIEELLDIFGGVGPVRGDGTLGIASSGKLDIKIYSKK